MGSIGIIFLDYSAKSKIFNLPKHIQLLRCPGQLARVGPLTAGLRRSSPAIRWSVASALWRRSRIRGSACVFQMVRESRGWTRAVRLRLTLELRGGGDEETRTPDPLLAKEMLYQLSYVPGVGVGDGGRFWTRTRDLCLIRAVL